MLLFRYKHFVFIYLQSVHVACVGEGPVVHVMPQDLDWGVVPVLQDKPKKILLSNESLIPARFTAHMVNKCCFQNAACSITFVEMFYNYVE